MQVQGAGARSRCKVLVKEQVQGAGVGGGAHLYRRHHVPLRHHDHLGLDVPHQLPRLCEVEGGVDGAVEGLHGQGLEGGEGGLGGGDYVVGWRCRWSRVKKN